MMLLVIRSPAGLTLGIQTAQCRYYSQTTGPNVGILCRLGSQGLGCLRVFVFVAALGLRLNSQDESNSLLPLGSLADLERPKLFDNKGSKNPPSTTTVA